MAAGFDARHDSPPLRRATEAFVGALLDEILPDMRLAAKGCGYAITVHGSLARDVDLVAIAWEERADTPELLVQRLTGVLAGKFGRAVYQRSRDDWTAKPHCRLALTIILPGMCPEIDLSIIPPAAPEAD